MPYFVFELGPEKDLTYIDEFNDFQSAKNLSRKRRAESQSMPDTTVRMVFAEDRKKAKSLLREARQPASPIEDWED